MNSIDLTPLYRSTIGFDRLASLFDNALSTESSSSGYPPYNIEACDENVYTITLAVAGFEKNELDINVEKGVLTVLGKKEHDDTHQYLHQGIANRAFERQFNLADYVEVTGASLNNGLLSISLVKEVPEAMKPKRITISQDNDYIEHQQEDNNSEDKSEQAA
ncbi:MAG TPA: Hsp20 family protein [Gammaproteobacteria bacterium]|nr:Hsp20 family protein [Gammaproteobacteria bacterium]